MRVTECFHARVLYCVHPGRMLMASLRFGKAFLVECLLARLANSLVSALPVAREVLPARVRVWVF